MCILMQGIRKQKDSYCFSLNFNVSFGEIYLQILPTIRVETLEYYILNYSTTQSLKIVFISMKTFQTSFNYYSNSKTEEDVSHLTGSGKVLAYSWPVPQHLVKT